MQSRLSLSLWRSAISHIEDESVRQRLLNQVDSRDDLLICQKGWLVVLRAWRSLPITEPSDVVTEIPGDHLLANVHFRLPPAKDRFTAKLHLAAGRLFELEFNRPISAEWQRQLPIIDEVVMYPSWSARPDFDLPADYIERLQSQDGFKQGNVTIYAREETQAILEGGKSYLLVGELPGDRFLVFGSGKPNLLCVDHEFSNIADLGASFIEALRTLAA